MFSRYKLTFLKKTSHYIIKHVESNTKLYYYLENGSVVIPLEWGPVGRMILTFPIE